MENPIFTQNFTLKKAARSTGSDRYTSVDVEPSWDIYIPQYITRADTGSPTPNIEITLVVNLES